MGGSKKGNGKGEKDWTQEAERWKRCLWLLDPFPELSVSHPLTGKDWRRQRPWLIQAGIWVGLRKDLHRDPQACLSSSPFPQAEAKGGETFSNPLLFITPIQKWGQEER